MPTPAVSSRRHSSPPPARRPVPHPAAAPLREAVGSLFGVPPSRLGAPARGDARTALARQAAIYLAHTTLGLSLTAAGRLFNRDRTTAAHACRVVEARRDRPAFDRKLGALEAVLAGGNCEEWQA